MSHRTNYSYRNCDCSRFLVTRPFSCRSMICYYHTSESPFFRTGLSFDVTSSKHHRSHHHQQYSGFICPD